MASQQAHSTISSNVARALTWRYLIALLLVASFATAAWISLHLVISEQASTAALVNVSGRQRMLSQRAALYSHLLASAPRAERPAIRDKLHDAIELMARSHHGLTHGDEKLGLPATMSPTVHAMYFDGTDALDPQVTAYIQAVRELLQLDDGKLNPEPPPLQYITKVAPSTLLNSLDRMVNQYQREGEDAIARLQKAETIFWLATLLLLTLEAILIFQPFARHLRSAISKLQAVTEQLRMHQDQLEQLVKHRTADLEHKRNQLAVSERRLRTLIDYSPFSICEIDLNGRIQSINRAGLEMLGLADEKDIYLSPYLDTVSEHDRVHVQALMQQAFDGQSGRFEFTAPGASPRHFKSCFIPLRDHDGKVAKLMGLTEDITESWKFEAILSASEEKFRSLFESANDCIELIAMDGRILDINHVGHELLGYSKAEMQGQPLSTFNSPKYAALISERMTLIQSQGHATFESARLHKDGTEIPIEVSSRLVSMDGQQAFLSISRDIRERKKTEEVLLQQKQLSDDIINSLPGIFYMLNTQGQFVRVNSSFLTTSGYSQAELDRMSALDFFEGDDQALIAQRMQEVFETGSSWAEADFVIKSGDRLPYYFTGHRILIDGEPHLVGLGTDITERKRSEDALRITASVFDTSQEAILITDASNVIVDANPAFTRITGYTRAEVIGRNPKLLSSGRQDADFYTAMWKSLAEKKYWRGEIWNRRKSGESYAELLSISVICDGNGNVQRHVAVFSDISHLKAHEAELSRIAHYDALTGIPNRVLLADRLKQAFAQTQREGDMMAVCYLDLDGFKPINDTLGHEAGDEVLIEISQRIESAIRGGDTVARLGGDEFVVALLGLERGEECVATLERLLDAIGQPIDIKDQSFSVSASIGVSLYPLDEGDPDTLLRHADQAMYIAKQSGKNRFHIYDPALDLHARSKQDFLENIHLGLEQNQFELYYQPKLKLGNRELVGAEALIRWHHPERGLVPPAEFLRSIESTELEIETGDWVIASALQQLEQWRQQGLQLDISINISAYHLESVGFVEKLRKQLARYPELLPQQLQIEVLETAALNDIAIVRGIIESCRKLGVGFALDDFGTGYSSLSYLSSLPVDELKIDQSFVRDMLEDEADLVIVEGVIALARAFNLRTVAEGIETEAHYQALLDMGCEVGQGYGIARPMPANDLSRWAVDHASLVATSGHQTKDAS